MKRVEQPALMSYRQALKYINIGSYQTLYKLIADGLKVTTLGNRNFISVKSADEYIDEHTRQVDSAKQAFDELNRKDSK